MSEGVATFSGLFLDRSGHNVKLRFSLLNFDRSTGDWNEAGVYLDTDFFHVEEGLPAALLLEQVENPNVHFDILQLMVDTLALAEDAFASHQPDVVMISISVYLAR